MLSQVERRRTGSRPGSGQHETPVRGITGWARRAQRQRLQVYAPPQPRAGP